jgi:RNA polymerase sigma-70 factor (ECF subfamily)
LSGKVLQLNPATAVDVELWVQQAQQGCLQAFECLYRHFKGRIYALCFRMCANEALAEELMQEAFVLAWRKIQSFKAEAQFGTWLHRLCSNLVISYFRRNKHRELDGFELPELPGVDESLQFAMQRDLELAIAQLPVKARLILVMHDIEGMTHQEIAEMMAISVGTCKAQLHRARNLLKERLL